MVQMPYVCLYLDYLDNFRGLSDAAFGKLIRAMLQFAVTGEAPQVTGPAGIVWPSVRSQIERDAKKYLDRCETNRINGAKGGRPPKNPTVTSETEGLLKKPKKPKEKEKEKENENKNNNDNNNEIEKEKEKKNPDQTFPRTQKEWEDAIFARRAAQFRATKGYRREEDSLTPPDTPEYLRADSSTFDKWLPELKSEWH